MKVENLREVPSETLRMMRDGFQNLRANQFYLHLEDILDRELTASQGIVESGSFPPSTDGRPVGDWQGILLRDQLIGEVRGLRRGKTLLSHLITALSDELGRREEANKEQKHESNDPAV